MIHSIHITQKEKITSVVHTGKFCCDLMCNFLLYMDESITACKKNVSLLENKLKVIVFAICSQCINYYSSSVLISIGFPSGPIVTGLTIPFSFNLLNRFASFSASSCFSSSLILSSGFSTFGSACAPAKKGRD